MGGEPVVRVVVADDQRLVRTGFRVILGDADGIEVVGEAADGVEAVELARALQPGRGAHGHPDAAPGRDRRRPGRWWPRTASPGARS